MLLRALSCIPSHRPLLFWPCLLLFRCDMRWGQGGKFTASWLSLRKMDRLVTILEYQAQEQRLEPGFSQCYYYKASGQRAVCWPPPQ